MVGTDKTMELWRPSGAYLIYKLTDCIVFMQMINNNYQSPGLNEIPLMLEMSGLSTVRKPLRPGT